MRLCETCGWQPAKIKGECRTCYQFRYRHGIQRPEHLIVRHGRALLAGRSFRGGRPALDRITSM